MSKTFDEFDDTWTTPVETVQAQPHPHPHTQLHPPVLSLKGKTREETTISPSANVVVWHSWKIITMVGVILILVGIIGFMFYKADKEKSACPISKNNHHSHVTDAKINSDLTGKFRDLHNSHKPSKQQPLNPIQSPTPSPPTQQHIVIATISSNSDTVTSPPPVEKTTATVEEIEEVEDLPDLIVDQDQVLLHDVDD
jgi:hypothetical protein